VKVHREVRWLKVTTVPMAVRTVGPRGEPASQFCWTFVPAAGQRVRRFLRLSRLNPLGRILVGRESDAIASVGLALDILGAVLLWKYGLPEHINRNGHQYWILEQVDEAEAEKAKRYDVYSKAG
jgi:hypothetical protein